MMDTVQKHNYCTQFTVFSIEKQIVGSHCATLLKDNNILSSNIEVRTTGRIVNEVKPSMKII
jgi:hypothetical protein